MKYLLTLATGCTLAGLFWLVAWALSDGAVAPAGQDFLWIGGFVVSGMLSQLLVGMFEA